MAKKATKEYTVPIFVSTRPASLELLDPLFDWLGIGKEDDSRSESPEQKELAKEAAKNYFTELINIWGIKRKSPTMATIKDLSCAFYDGYLAGLGGIIHPPIHD